MFLTPTVFAFRLPPLRRCPILLSNIPTSRAVSCVCLCVGTPVSSLPWEPWESLGRRLGEGQMLEVLCLPSFNPFLSGTSRPTQLPFL